MPALAPRSSIIRMGVVLCAGVVTSVPFSPCHCWVFLSLLAVCSSGEMTVLNTGLLTLFCESSSCERCREELHFHLLEVTWNLYIFISQQEDFSIHNIWREPRGTCWCQPAYRCAGIRIASRGLPFVFQPRLIECHSFLCARFG